MKVLFVHQNFPAQYVHLAQALARRGDDVTALTMNACRPINGIRILRHEVSRGNTQGIHPWISDLESKVIRGESAGRAAHSLKKQGYVPDVICAHPGWGETLFLKDVWPNVPILAYWEYYYRYSGADLNFDPEFADTSWKSAARLRAKNAHNLLSLEAIDHGVCPTQWQRVQFPEWAQEAIEVIHDGIDTGTVVPNRDPNFSVKLAETRWSSADELVTFVSRSLEPYRGFHSFMRALPTVMAARPRAHILIVGTEGVSYGAPPKSGTWKSIYFEEVAPYLDRTRIHFLGQLPYAAYLQLLQISSVHVYLTYPFVLSWSMLEAMSAECLLIGSATPPVMEVLEDGKNGLLTDFFDAEALSGRIIDCLARPDDYQGIRQAARKTITERFDLKNICLPRHIQLVDQVASRR